jgi:acetyl-CoA acetyltransferase
MSAEVYVIGAYSTSFGRWPDRSFQDLTREACLGAFTDAGFSGDAPVDGVWFANSGMGAWGQTSIRGQVALAPLVRDGFLPRHAPVVNVENACASGSTALHCASIEILAGQSHLTLAAGVEKLHFPSFDRSKVLEGFAAGLDNLDRDRWLDECRSFARDCNSEFEFAAGRSPFVDLCALRARWHMQQHGLTCRQMALVAEKSHWYGARNPKAFYRFELPVDRVLGDRPVTDPLTRAMCAAPGDGAAAVVLCSDIGLRDLPAAVRNRAVRIRASALAGGRRRTPADPSATRAAALKAYRSAGIQPERVNVAEVHDGTAFSEIFELEMLGFCADGDGGRFAESGATGPGGRLPVNTSGGLLSKTHPVAASGLSMTQELVTQLRGEARERQVQDADIALQQNAGGAMGIDDAVSAVVLFGRVVTGAVPVTR